MPAAMRSSCLRLRLTAVPAPGPAPIMGRAGARGISSTNRPTGEKSGMGYNKETLSLSLSLLKGSRNAMLASNGSASLVISRSFSSSVSSSSPLHSSWKSVSQRLAIGCNATSSRITPSGVCNRAFTTANRREDSTTTTPATPTTSATVTTPPAQSPIAPSSLSSSSPSSISSTPPSSTSSSADILTWDRYLHLRTIRRRYNLAFSAITALGTTVAGAAVLSQQDPDSMGAMSFGLDPVVVLGAATVACGALGWLLGPFAGGAVFGVVYRRFAKAMEGKEREFYQRIKRYRSDPAGQSMNNPVPDYYGEKITSVRDYRRWLKDQRAFRKKRGG